jgi:hypothetical protein
VMIAVAVKPGAFRSCRSASRKSASIRPSHLSVTFRTAIREHAFRGSRRLFANCYDICPAREHLRVSALL